MGFDVIAVIKTYSDAWGGNQVREKDICPSISARDWKDPLRVVIEYEE